MDSVFLALLALSTWAQYNSYDFCMAQLFYFATMKKRFSTLYLTFVTQVSRSTRTLSLILLAVRL